MSTIIRELQPLNTSTKSKDNAPVIVPWKGENMIRNQSIRAAVHEIVKMSTNADVVKINLVGKPGTGKTTLAKCIGHLVHKMSDIPFAVKMFTKHDLMNFEQTLKELNPANYILIFDDVSFMGAKTSKKQIETVKQAFTEIRHLEGGKDVKIIAIFNFHYTLALDKYLRQSEFQFFTSIGSSEFENTLQLVGVKNTRKILTFQKAVQEAYMKDKWNVMIGNKKWFTYDFRDPFIPLLFWNGSTCRATVSPTREWVDKFCPICSDIEGKRKSDINIPKFIEECNATFSKGLIKNIIKQMLKEQGINCYGKEYTRGRRYIERALEMGQFTVDNLADYLNIKPTKTRLDVKPKVVKL